MCGFGQSISRYGVKAAYLYGAPRTARRSLLVARSGATSRPTAGEPARDYGGDRKRLGSVDTRSALQEVAMQVVPAASSIAQSIRVMIREGYLVSALILLRPLWERIATLCYLERHEEAITLWREGWPHRTRPSLKDRESAMMPGANHLLITQLTTAVSAYNSVVHGDPTAAQQSLAQTGDGIAYITDRDYRSPARAHSIAGRPGLPWPFSLRERKSSFSYRRRYGTLCADFASRGSQRRTAKYEA